MKENEKIQKVQDLIKSLGLEDKKEFKEILDIDSTSEECKAEHDYWNKLYKKSLIYISNNAIKIIHVVDVKCHKKQIWGGHYVTVFVDRYYINFENGAISTYREYNHNLCSPTVDRYNEFKEISDEQFISYISYLDSLVCYGNEIFNKIKGES